MRPTPCHFVRVGVPDDPHPPRPLLCPRRAGCPHPAADDGCSFKKCHSEERSDVGIRSPYVSSCVGVRIATPVTSVTGSQ